MSKRSRNLFTQVPVKNPSRNFFDLSHEVKMSGKFGYLYPCLLMDCLPGDVITDTMVAMVRFAPMLAPIMHRVDVKTDFFFVPSRLLSDSWEDFITGGQDGTAAPTLAYITPQILAGATSYMSKGTLWDYFGLPTDAFDPPPANMSEERVSLAPFQAYMKIFNDYFRDPNLDDEVDFHPELDGAFTELQATPLMTIKQRGWERDYFTAALPWAQRGAEVLMPLAGSASVNYKPQSLAEITGTGFGADAGPIDVVGVLGGLQDSGAHSIYIDNIEDIEIDGATTTINDFRRAIAIQSWMENNARGGGRYNEQIEAHFNVRVPDYRLQRAEYLGGGRQAVTISEVLATAESETPDADRVPIGDMAGHGISVGKSNRFRYRCEEHGWVIGIMSVVPRTAYQQGVPRMFSRQQKFDYAFPELAHLGEQEILNKELFYSFDEADDVANNETFGYIPRYSEYKFMNDRVAGDFRDTLNFWHLGRIFGERPALDTNFLKILEDGDPLEASYRRIFANQDGTDYLWFQLYHKLGAERPLPYFGVPMING